MPGGMMVNQPGGTPHLLLILVVLVTLFGLGVGPQHTRSEKAQGRGKPLHAPREATLEPKGAKNPRISSIRIVQQVGARPRFSPDGQRIVFDRLNADRFYDVYTASADGSDVRAITEGKSGIGQRNNGNAIFDHSGRYIVFISEEENHLLEQVRRLADPGVGLFSNVWATDLDGRQFWKLTDIPIKRKFLDLKTPTIASVNPVFSRDGSRFVWTERYAEGGHNNWGRWRIMIADFRVEDGRPVLRNDRVLLTPEKGNYATGMGFLDARRLVLAGNLEGQHEYGM